MRPHTESSANGGRKYIRRPSLALVRKIAWRGPPRLQRSDAESAAVPARGAPPAPSASGASRTPRRDPRARRSQEIYQVRTSQDYDMHVTPATHQRSRQSPHLQHPSEPLHAFASAHEPPYWPSLQGALSRRGPMCALQCSRDEFKGPGNISPPARAKLNLGSAATREALSVNTATLDDGGRLEEGRRSCMAVARSILLTPFAFLILRLDVLNLIDGVRLQISWQGPLK